MLLISHYVGFVQVNKTRVVYPKIALNIADENLHKSIDILIKMFAYTALTKLREFIHLACRTI